MTSFEFVFGLISVVTSLALTQMLSGCVALYRNAERVRPSWRHALWVVTAFMVLIGNWAAFWRMRDTQVWSMFDVLSPLVFISVLYAFCDMVLPDRQAERKVIDLREYHANEGRRYKLLNIAFAVLSMIYLIHVSSNFEQWLQRAVFALVAALIGVVALRARRVWLDTATSIGMTVLGVIFMTHQLQQLSG
ncbi:MAG: hypothetical protein ABI870_04210 [Rhodanobacter sp.]